MKYPRKLTEQEKDWLYYLLPAERKGYAEYRKKLEGMQVIGEGRFGEGNYILGYEKDVPDPSYPSLPVFACGQILFEKCTVQVTIHEEHDNKVEYSINNINGEGLPEGQKEKSRWSNSYWKPGEKSQFNNNELREIEVTKNKGEIVIVLSKVNPSICIYEEETGINHIIPATNYLNELLRGKTNIDKTKGVNVKYVMDHNEIFKDEDYIKAFVQYSKQWRKIDLSKYEKEIKEPKKKE